MGCWFMNYGSKKLDSIELSGVINRKPFGLETFAVPSTCSGVLGADKGNSYESTRSIRTGLQL